MSENDLFDESDCSDEDYVPKNEELPSENESEGDNEDPISDSEELVTKRKRNSSSKSSKKRRSRGNCEEKDCQVSSTSDKATEEDKKKKDDDLWADFMKDTGFKSRTSLDKNLTPNNENKIGTTSQIKEECSKNSTQLVKNKVKITEVFEFAGEEVKVEKEVDKNSAEARLLSKDVPKTTSSKRGGLSGIGNVLSNLGKKRKITTLEKTKLDWDKFKKEEKIEEELTTHNKGKDGYLDRQDFLQRADLRRFEIEKNIRDVERSKRLNTTL